jgi:hypothetical protein
MYEKLIEAGVKGVLKFAVKKGLSSAQMNGANSIAAKHGDVLLQEPAHFCYKQKLAHSNGVVIIAGSALIYQIKGQIPVPGAFPYRMEFDIPSLSFKEFRGRTLIFLGLKDTFGIEINTTDGDHLVAFVSEEVRNRVLLKMNEVRN